jgi:hypothetical protein
MLGDLYGHTGLDTKCLYDVAVQNLGASKSVSCNKMIFDDLYVISLR